MNEIDAGMAVEFRAAPDAVRRQAQVLAAPIAELAARLKRHAPRSVVHLRARKLGPCGDLRPST